jgi:putative lipoprotein
LTHQAVASKGASAAFPSPVVEVLAGRGDKLRPATHLQRVEAMLYGKLTFMPVLGLIGWLAGCSTAGVVPHDGGSGAAQVTGTIAYRERIALSPTAVISVKIVDVSRADAPAIVLGEQLIEAAGKQVPFPFSIAYDPAGIDPRMSYAVQARIEDGGRLMFISDQNYAVITRGAPAHVDLVLKAVGRN